MMYIFEGVDHSGKDTLIKNLLELRKAIGKKPIPVFDGLNIHDQEQMPQNIKQYVVNPNEWQKAIGYEIVNFVRQTLTDVIINRFTWSEIVYGSVIRNWYDKLWYNDVMNEELRGVATIIYVDAPIDIIRSRIEHSSKKKSQKIIDNLMNLKSEYQNLISNSGLKVITIESKDISVFSVSSLLEINKKVFGDL